MRTDSRPSLVSFDPELANEDPKDRVNRISKLIADAVEDQDASALLSAIIEAKGAHMDRKFIDEATHRLQQLEAKDALERGMKNNDLVALRRAVANAGQANVEGIGLQKAKNKLEKLEAEESLRCATGSPETGALRIAIRRAQLAGLGLEEGSKEMLAEAQRMLEQIEAQRMLELALASKDKSKLEDAVERAQICKLQSPEFEQASAQVGELDAAARTLQPQRSFASAGKMQEVQEQLQRAISMQETGGLRDAIRRATINHVSVPELAVAEHMLKVLETQRLLDASVRGKTHDPKKLKEAIVAAAGCGMQDEVVDYAKQLLEQHEAREFLSAAITGKDTELLPEAIERAKNGGVERQKVVKGQELLQSLQAKAEKEAAGEAASPMNRPRQSLRRTTTMAAGSRIAGTEEARRPAVKRATTIGFGVEG